MLIRSILGGSKNPLWMNMSHMFNTYIWSIVTHDKFECYKKVIILDVEL